MIKQELRAHMRQLAKQQSSKRLAHADAVIVRKLIELVRQHGFQSIGVYASKDASEPDIPAFIDEILTQNITVCLPRIHDSTTMDFYQIQQDEKLQANQFGIAEPLKEPAKLISPIELDAIIIPGLAFTGDGKRLGRGKGYYDRYLRQVHSDCLKIGVCYSYQIQESIFTDELDLDVDLVISEKINT